MPNIAKWWEVSMIGGIVHLKFSMGWGGHCHTKPPSCGLWHVIALQFHAVIGTSYPNNITTWQWFFWRRNLVPRDQQMCCPCSMCMTEHSWRLLLKVLVELFHQASEKIYCRQVVCKTFDFVSVVYFTFMLSHASHPCIVPGWGQTKNIPQ